MKSLLNGFFTAFAMYSIIPMPQIQWSKNTMKYAIAFFPAIGAVIGCALFWVNNLLVYFNISPVLYGAVMTVLPIILSGGIHIDGFIDTCDARYSRQDREKKLQILKDPHVGAFGIISVVVLGLLWLGIWTQFFDLKKHLIILCIMPFVSRCLSGLFIVSFKMAKNTGLAYMFADNAHKKQVRIALLTELVFAVGVIAFLNIKIALILLFVSLMWIGLFKRICYKEFGGITGDLAGFFLVVYEFLWLLTVVIGAFI